MVTSEAGRADALVAVDQVVARAVVLARVRQALVKLEVAVVAGEPGTAVALVRACVLKFEHVGKHVIRQGDDCQSKWQN